MALFFFAVFQTRLQGSARLGLVLIAVYVDFIAKSRDCKSGVYIILYADDILLLSPTVSDLQDILHVCICRCIMSMVEIMALITITPNVNN